MFQRFSVQHPISLLNEWSFHLFLQCVKMINSLSPVCLISKCICILCVMLSCEKHYALDEVRLSRRDPPRQTSRLVV